MTREMSVGSVVISLRILGVTSVARHGAVFA
jgi:hypothetical protein